MKATRLKELLEQYEYDILETQFLYKGFTEGFNLEYQGPKARQSQSRNIPITVGCNTTIWNKLIKEIQEKRVAGPYEQIPFANFIQSPIGLVPKSGSLSGDMRLIFHLSYDLADSKKSVNYHIPQELCSVKYQDLDYVVKTCLFAWKRAISLAQANNVMPNSLNNRELLNMTGAPVTLFLGKTDLKSAFRVLPISQKSYPWVIMQCQDPSNGQIRFFIEKSLPFGSSISCSHFQRFSNCLKFLIEKITGLPLSTTNYLDDYLFVHESREICNYLVRQFLLLCQDIGFPVSVEKTEWATPNIVFLGILLNGQDRMLSVPLEKRQRATLLLMHFLSKKKATVRELQQLCGYLNFLTRAIFPGRAFLRRMYAKYAGCLKTSKNSKLKAHHHVRLDQEFKFDCQVWLEFLTMERQCVVNRPMVDLQAEINATDLGFHSDVSPAYGLGAIMQKQWIFAAWDKDFIKKEIPVLNIWNCLPYVLASSPGSRS